MIRRRPAQKASPKKLYGAAATRGLLKRIEVKGLTMKRVAEAFDTHTATTLLNRQLYPKQVDKMTVADLQGFLHKWINRNVKWITTLHQQAGKIKKRQKNVPESEIFRNLLAKEGKFAMKRVAEKAAFEQLLEVLSQRMKAKGKVNQVAATRTVKEWGRRFLDKKDLPGSFVRLAEAVAKIPMSHAPGQIARAYYGLPTAEDTIRANNIPIFFRKNYPAWGCGMQCNVINAVLNGWGWKNFHVRTRTEIGSPHSVVVTKIPHTNIQLIADPFLEGRTFLGGKKRFKKSPVVAEVRPETKGFIEGLKDEGNWRLGRRLSDHVTNYIEYDIGK